MEKLKLISFNDPLLKRAPALFDFEKENAEEISERLFIGMRQFGGVGLSANQVGFDGQIFVMKAQTNMQFGPYITVINPHIKGLSKEIEPGEEGCLSHPGLILKVRRPISAMVEFDTLTPDYKSTIHVETKFDDLDARIFLHEYDHLYGIQFIDRVSKLKLEMAEKKRYKKRKIHG